MQDRCVILVANRGFALSSSRRLLIRRFLDCGWRVVIATADDEYSRALCDDGAILESVDFSRGGFSIVRDAAAFRRLRTIYRKWVPRLVHHFHAKPIIFGSIVAGGTQPKPVTINTVTGLGHAFVNGGAVRSLAAVGYRLALRNADVTVFQNRDDLELFVTRQWVRRPNTRLIVGSGVDTGRFRMAELDSGSRSGAKVIMVGRLIWQKGIREFIEAARRLKARRQDVEFILAGEEDPVHPDAVPMSWLEEQCRSGAVTFAGYVRQIDSLLREADIFVLPSYYREGVPRVALEAAACGVPTVAADVPGTREAVRDGETGYLVPAKNVEALTQRIEDLLENPERRRAMGRRARLLVEGDFDIKAITQRYIDTYNAVGVEI
ncbi:MAG: glycosyltransferase family 4 protein [Nitrococcus mobilis]|nr:glycosyltransferase family 4 protein [Nitrococcus mobilis]